MGSNQLLKVGVTGLNSCSGWQFFYAKIGKDGSIFIPKLTRLLLKKEKPNIFLKSWKYRLSHLI